MDINEILNAPKVTVSLIDTTMVDKTFIKEFRIKYNLTQVALANIIGVTKDTIIKWEQGVKKINKTSATLLALLDSDKEIFNKVYKVEYN